MGPGSRLVRFIQASRPLFLLGAALLYALGCGVARYLGVSIDWGIYLLGQGLVTSVQLGAHYLNEYYDGEIDRRNSNRTPFSGGSGRIGEDGVPRRILQAAAAGCLLSSLAFVLLFIIMGKAVPEFWLLFGAALLAAVFYSVPPLRLVSSGYGELTTSILVANLVPTFSFFLQAGELHRLLAMSTFPLTLMHMAMMLAFEVPDYAADLKYQKRTLMVRIGWQKAMSIHNVLIVGVYLLFGLAISLGMPIAIALPAVLTIPIGLLQIWQMHRVASGAPPNYLTLTMTPLVLFGTIAYLLAFGFWTR